MNAGNHRKVRTGRISPYGDSPRRKNIVQGKLYFGSIFLKGFDKLMMNSIKSVLAYVNRASNAQSIHNFK